MTAAARTLDLASLAREIESLGVDPRTLDGTRFARQAGALMGAEWRRCFAESRTPDGLPWPPLKRPRRRGGSKPLVDTGFLMASGRTRVSLAEGMARVTVEQDSAATYAGYQNFGTATIPARTFAGVGERAAQRIEQMAADEMVRQLGF